MKVRAFYTTVTQIHDIYSRNEKLWQQIIDHSIPLPTTLIKVFDHKGNIKELRTYSDVAATEQLSVSQLGTSCTGSTAHLEQAMPSVLADSTGTKLSPTYTQMGSGLQISSASKGKTNSEHSTGQLACCVSRSHSCIDLRSISNYSNQQTSDIQSLSRSCPNIHNVCACLIKTSALTHQNSNSFPKNGLACLSASAMIPSPHDKLMVLQN